MIYSKTKKSLKMNNEEKKKFIAEIHRLLMSIRPYDNKLSLSLVKEKEDLMWEQFKCDFYNKQPKSFFKYRKANELNISNLENDIAWFSKPVEFGDTVDFTLNTDIEDELEDFKKHPQEYTKKVAVAFINYWLRPYGQTIDEKMVDMALPLFNENGEVSEDDAKAFLKDKMPEYSSDVYSKKLCEVTQLPNQEPTKEAIEGFLKTYLGFNNRLRNESFVFCLAEEGNNQAMWETYADGATGFCIEYQIPNDTFLGQRMLMNLLPIYYGEKEPIKFFDILVKGLTADKQVNGVSYEDYEKWFLSSYTKDPSYAFQKEWRIVFTQDMGGNSQSFPFVKSIILGEKISEDNKKKLVDLANRRGFEIYQRKLNVSGSKIVVVKL